MDHCEAQLRDFNSPARVLKNSVKKLIGRSVTPPHLLIPLASMKTEIGKQGKVRVLDIGGGFGDNYLHFSAKLPSAQMDYCVVDNSRQCELGRRHFGGAGPRFALEIPAESYDLAIIVGTLQYVEDWKDFLATVCRLTKLVYVARTPLHLGGVTFNTVQTIAPGFGLAKGTKIGEANVRVLGYGAFETVMSACGFSMKESAPIVDYSAAFARLPESHQQVGYRHMLWQKKS